MKTYVIGDIHGCYEELTELLDLIDAHAKKTDGDYRMVFLGDYVDRGPDSKRVICTLMNLEMALGRDRVICLKGNHEDMLLAGDYTYARETLESFRESPHIAEIPEWALSWMADLRLYFEDAYAVYVHAYVKPSVPLEEQTETNLLWTRYEKEQRAFYDKFVYHGHTPTRDLEVVEDRCNVDTACVFGGHLTAVEVGPEGKPGHVIQVRNKRS